jgi:repressor LexA
VPVVGAIAAGQPIEANVDTDSYVTVQGASADNLYALRVNGTSMIEDLIDDGDIVVVSPQETASDGDTVVALLLNGPTDAGEATLKRFYRERDRVRLEPRNPTMQPIYVQPNDLRIQGKVVTVIRQLV